LHASHMEFFKDYYDVRFLKSYCMDDVSSTLLFFEKKITKLEVFPWTSSLRRAWVFFSRPNARAWRTKPSNTWPFFFTIF
jgi:hypothetical protein